MANSLITPDMIAKEALMQVENNLVMAKLVHRQLETEFKGHIGGSIRVRRPVRYNIRTGPVMSVQDTEEGNITVTIDRQRGVDFGFGGVDLTLSITEFSNRYLKAGCAEIAQYIDADILSQYYKIANWAGETGQTINSYGDFTKGPERLDTNAVPKADRVAVLSTTDKWALVGTLSGIFVEKRAEEAIKRAEIGMLGDCDTYDSQNVPVHTTGALGGSPVTNTSTQPTTWALAKGTTPLQQTLAVTAASTGVTGWAKRGDVFTIVGVNDVNPRIRDTSLGRLKQFTVLADADSDGGGAVSLTISPAIITSGPYRNCVISSAGSGKALVFMGAGGATNRMNLVMNKDALGLYMVPMILPEGAKDAARTSANGLSIRVIPVYDGQNDNSAWRLDVLYGVEAIYPELATRLTGTA